MKPIYSLLTLLGMASLGFGQVGIATSNPQSTLDVTGNGTSTAAKDGMMAPRITRQQLAAKVAGTYAAVQSGSMVYVTDASTPTGTIPSVAQTVEITAAGYYFFNGTLWKNVNDNIVNLYNSNGTLTGPRTVTQAANTLAFTGTAVNAFSVDGTTLSVDAANDRIGIGNNAPVVKLDIVGTTFGMKSATGSGSWDNIWFNVTPSIPSINASGAESGLQFNVGANSTGTYGDGQTLTTVATMLSNGNMGVGSTSPTRKLHVEGSGLFNAAVTTSVTKNAIDINIGQDGFAYGNRTDNFGINIRSASTVGTGSVARINFGDVNTTTAGLGKYLSFSVGNGLNELMYMTDNNSGRVGIGTITPTEKLHVIGNILASGTITPSDIRIKKDIVDNSYGLKEILGLRTISYRYKDESLSKDKKVGFVAQEIKAAMPELVTTANDEMKTLGVNYAEMTVVLTKAVQQQQEMLQKQGEMLKRQQEQINSLKTEIKKLKTKL